MQQEQEVDLARSLMLFGRQKTTPLGFFSIQGHSPNTSVRQVPSGLDPTRRFAHWCGLHEQELHDF